MHDYLTQRGGAERVVLSILKAFPGAPLYTALYDPDATYPEFANHDVRTLWSNRLPPLRRNHRLGLLLYPFVFSGLEIDADLVLCSSSGFAHGVRTKGRKVVYCYTPPRWLYDQADTYLEGWPRPISAVVRAAGPALRRWDRKAARSADSYLTSSTMVQERIRQAYGIEAEVVAPPVTPSVGQSSRPEPGFVLCVSRLLTYKNVDAVVGAFDHLPGARLVVTGSGPERSHLQAAAGPNVSLLGRVHDSELAWLYANCAGVIAASYEDYGLVPLEAATHGKPVAVLRAGGFLDTVVEGETGVFFDHPETASIARAVETLLRKPWDGARIMRHADEFTESSFGGRLHLAMAGARLKVS